MGRLFGTDGIRGIAGEAPLDRETIYRVGCALTHHLRNSTDRPRILLGRDTRDSGPWIEKILECAIASSGGLSESCGVISTPAVSHLTRAYGADAGIVISASHNPYRDNGIKIFSSAGMKFSDAVEDKLESLILADCRVPPDGFPAEADLPPLAAAATSHRARYLQHVRECVPPWFNLEGRQMVVDCGNGALSSIAPPFFRCLGACVHPLHCEPDGKNINRDAGALHLESLRRTVIATGSQLGVAYDGDADRAMFIDETGTVRDGDDVLFLLVRHLAFGSAPRIVVGTIMANLGLELALRELGIELVRTAVGDRYVLEEMLKLGALLGGEQSGHVILLDHASTGDGLLTSLKVLQILGEARESASQLCSPLRRFPQVLHNIRVRTKIPFDEIPGLANAREDCRLRLGPHSRIVVRYSGTEMLARVMVEAQDEARVRDAAAVLASCFERIKGDSRV